MASPTSALFLVVLTFLSAEFAKAQSDGAQKCDGPIHSAKEVAQRAKIASRSIPEMTNEALANDVHGRIVVEAVLCRTGSVTDIQVIEDLPYGMTEKAIAAVREVKFTPAELNGQPVSQRIRFEFHFNERGLNKLEAKEAEGRLIEFLEIVGNRRISTGEVRQWIRTNPGELFTTRQIEEDLAALLATGYFSKENTRVSVEETARGGVGVIFEVHELPIITEVIFEGLSGISDSTALDALRKREIVFKGSVYDPVKVRAAIQIIENLLELNGQRGVHVMIRSEQNTSSELKITFFVVR